METVLQIDSQILRDIGMIAGKKGVEVYVVGGYVRDLILKKKCTDLDFTVVGDGIAFAMEVAREFGSAPPVIYEAFGTAMVPIEGGKLEFVGTRKEDYHPASRNPTVVTGNLRDDLERRDFTCNAIAISLNSNDLGRVIDPFHGIEAIAAGRLLTPKAPSQTFEEDPLRMMRACRFSAQLGFKIGDDELAVIPGLAGRLRIVSIERIRDEFIKILDSPKPSIGFRLLHKTGLLEIFFPEFHALAGVDQRTIESSQGRRNYHHKDVFFHTLSVIDNVAAMSGNTWLRMAALLHDIAKPLTKSFDESVGWSFHGHEILGSRMAKSIFRNLRLPMDPFRYVQKLISLHLRPIALVDEEVTDSAIRRLLFDAGEDIDDLMILCRADITSKNPSKVTRYLKNYQRVMTRMQEVEASDRLRNWQPPLRGDEIMQICNISEGRMVGILKTKIEDAILDGIIPNEHDAATEYLRTIKEEVIRNGEQRKPVPMRKRIKSLPSNLTN